MDNKINLLLLVIINEEDMASIAVSIDHSKISEDFLKYFKEDEFSGIREYLLPPGYKGFKIAAIDTIDKIHIL